MSDREAQVDYAAWDHVLSASQFENWELCRRKWWWKSVIKMPKAPKESTDFGNVMHGVLERWLSADDQGRGADGKPVDLYPKDWDVEEGRRLTPASAALVKTLVTKAIESGIITRRPGRQVEAGFVREVCPGVAIQGYIDLSFEDEVQDHKTTKSRRYAKTVDGLRRNPQLLVYARIVVDKNPGLGSVKVRHNTFINGLGKDKPRVMQIGPVEIPVVEIDEFWRTQLVPAAQEMVALKRKGFTETDYLKVAGPVDENESCNAFGGCEFLPICSGRCSPSDLRRTLSGVSSGALNTGDKNVASALDALLAGAPKGAAAAAVTPTPVNTAPPPSAPIPASAAPPSVAPNALASLLSKPATPPVNTTAAPASSAPVAAAPATNTVAAGGAVVSTVAGAPPWARGNCNSCKGTGFNLQNGTACYPCSSMARVRKDGSEPEAFSISIVDGIVMWRSFDGKRHGDFMLAKGAVVKSEVREAAPVDAGAMAKVGLAPAATPAALVLPTPPTATTAATEAAPTAEPAKRKRGRPPKTPSLTPPAADPTPTIAAPVAPVPALPAGQVPPATTAVLAAAGGVVSRDEADLHAAVDAPKPVDRAQVQNGPRGFILIIGSTLVGGIGMGQITTRDLSQIIRDRLAPEFEQSTGKKWFAVPVYERRDALLQRVPQIAQMLAGFITVDPNDSEAMPLARALFTLADGVFVSGR